MSGKYSKRKLDRSDVSTFFSFQFPCAFIHMLISQDHIDEPTHKKGKHCNEHLAENQRVYNKTNKTVIFGCNTEVVSQRI